jgi:hypothetical protein
VSRFFIVTNFAYRFPPHVREVETSLDKLQNRLINESHPDVSRRPFKGCFNTDTCCTQWLPVITIQTSMLVEGVVEIVKVASLDADILDHLKSKAVWKAALEYVRSAFLGEFEPDVA